MHAQHKSSTYQSLSFLQQFLQTEAKASLDKFSFDCMPPGFVRHVQDIVNGARSVQCPRNYIATNLLYIAFVGAVYPIFLGSLSTPFLPLLSYFLYSLDSTTNLLYTKFVPSFFIDCLWLPFLLLLSLLPKPTKETFVHLLLVVYPMPTHWFPLLFFLSSICATAPCLAHAWSTQNLGVRLPYFTSPSCNVVRLHVLLTVTVKFFLGGALFFFLLGVTHVCSRDTCQHRRDTSPHPTPPRLTSPHLTPSHLISPPPPPSDSVSHVSIGHSPYPPPLWASGVCVFRARLALERHAAIGHHCVITVGRRHRRVSGASVLRPPWVHIPNPHIR